MKGSSKILSPQLRPDVAFHYECVTNFLTGKTSRHYFKILDVCRLDNHHIIPASRFLTAIHKFTAHEKASTHNTAGTTKLLHEVVAFVPAAGAASRYFLPLYDFIYSHHLDLENLSKAECQLLLEHIEVSGWHVPQAFLDALKTDTKPNLDFLNRPKALQPIDQTGTTFLHAKNMEHEAMHVLSGQVFVATPGCVDEFKKILAHSTLKTSVLLQDETMSTVRVHEDLSIAIDSHNHFAYVPAGHGSLMALLYDMPKYYPSTSSIFIRNIDNVSGSDNEASRACLELLKLHDFILSRVKQIRTALTTNHMDLALMPGIELLQFCADVFHVEFKPDAETSLVLREVAKTLFFAQDHESLSDIFSKPVNTMGQVPIHGTDVGGSPAIAKTPLGDIRICLEGSHVTTEDYNSLLSPQATHFNPVFMVCEIPSSAQLDFFKEHPFYAIVEKTYLGKKVFYYESFLYEILGNSAFFNLVFIEIPRSLFHPHKTLGDSQ